MTPDLDRFTQIVREDPKQAITSVMGMLCRPVGLIDSFGRLGYNKAAGVDGVRKNDYEVGLDDSIADLSARLRRGGYKPQPVRRVYIPKASGHGRRPLGIPAFEDRIVQDRVSQILQAIWEPEFLDSSFGFRPGKSAHDALRRVDSIVMQKRTMWCVEADIKGFFNHMDHAWLTRFLEHRITDKRFIRVIQRFLMGGVMEDGVVSFAEEGTPQGGLVSPILSNIYLHYVLDLWFDRCIAPRCRGQAFVVRYCDDFVTFFERETDARQFMVDLRSRLAKFSLELEPTKTNVLRFGVGGGVPHLRQGPRTFDFLGLTHFITKSRFGRPMLGRQTARARAQRKLKEVDERLRRLRTSGTHAMLRFAIQHLRGHINYYGVSGNSRALSTYVWLVTRLLYRWLNRRSQRKSTNWDKFNLLLQSVKFPRPRVVHRMYG